MGWTLGYFLQLYFFFAPLIGLSFSLRITSFLLLLPPYDLTISFFASDPPSWGFAGANLQSALMLLPPIFQVSLTFFVSFDFISFTLFFFGPKMSYIHGLGFGSSTLLSNFVLSLERFVFSCPKFFLFLLKRKEK